MGLGAFLKKLHVGLGDSEDHTGGIVPEVKKPTVQAEKIALLRAGFVVGAPYFAPLNGSQAFQQFHTVGELAHLVFMPSSDLVALHNRLANCIEGVRLGHYDGIQSYEREELLARGVENYMGLVESLIPSISDTLKG